jgi:hypothetical protein
VPRPLVLVPPIGAGCRGRARIENYDELIRRSPINRLDWPSPVKFTARVGKVRRPLKRGPRVETACEFLTDPVHVNGPDCHHWRDGFMVACADSGTVLISVFKSRFG